MQNDAFLMEHLDALLVDRTLQGSDAAEDAAIRCLMQHQPGTDEACFDRVAALLDQAFVTKEPAPLPDSLMNRLQTHAAAFVFTPTVTDLRRGEEPRYTSQTTATPVVKPSRPSGNGILVWAGWLVAAVIFLFAVIPSGPTPYSLQQLKAMGANVVPGQPTAAGTPNSQGEFVWDSKVQQGYMKLSGFTINDPNRSQYQLWIFDEKEFTKLTPIDGGVFDVTSNKEVLIPIKANIKVGKPTLFAITVEQPGGVMQSKREKLIFVGSVAANPKS